MAQKRKNNNKMNMNMPRPSMLWIYGLIGAFIIGWYVFGDVNDTPLPSDWTTVREMVEKGDVEKIQVVNRDQAQVFLKKDAAEKYRSVTSDTRPMAVLSTASPFKFPSAVLKALDAAPTGDDFEDLRKISAISGLPVPENLANLEHLPAKHTNVIDKDEMLDVVRGM